MAVSIIHRDELHLGGFAGLREYRLVMAPRLWGEDANPGTHPGLGNFVYMADARFNPKGDTRMHHHQEVDVISVMLEGRLMHEGSLAHGQELIAPAVQVQRAGGEGFFHNEVNPDEVKNRMLQLWVLPDQAGEKAAYRLYQPAKGGLTRVYGGNEVRAEKEGQDLTLNNKTFIDVGLLNPGQEIVFEESFVVYIAKGRALARGLDPADKGSLVSEGDLLSGNHLDLKVESDVHLVVIRQN